jgi:CO dehydrogenase maturation factor
MEAGLEHLRRGTTRYVDAMLVVAEPYYKSLEIAGRAAELARELGIDRVYAIGNKARDERDVEAIHEYFARHFVPLVDTIPFDSAVVEADRRGLAPFDLEPEAPVVTAVANVARQVLQAEPVHVAEASERMNRVPPGWKPFER